jgi:rubrerythrin
MENKLMEMNRMDDLISRQAAIDALHMHLMYRMGTDSNKKRLDEWINNLPSTQPTIKPRKGKWIYNQKRGTVKIWTCSECGWNDIGEWNFCPNCGADMREEKEQ